jgi:N-acetyl sugar amidotransferase
MHLKEDGKMNKEIQTCTRCTFDSTIEDIWFDDKGVCKYCLIYDEQEKKHPLGQEGARILDETIEKIKKIGKGKRYDCIVGISGGRDSTYILHKAVELGLRPLAVHFDNGWNSDIAVKNIKKATDKLGIELYTLVADWEEFKDLQVSFLRSGTPDADIPTDYAIISTLHKIAAQEKVKYILNGHSFRTEGTTPLSWSYMDPVYVKAVHKKFGKKKIKSFPVMSMVRYIYYSTLKQINFFQLIEYVDYNRDKVDVVLKEKYDWQDYGGHHHENIYTKFFQSYYLPTRFNIDKRKREYSALIRSGQLSRHEALRRLETPYKYDESVVKYAVNKLGLSEKEFEDIMNSKTKSFHDYPTLFPLIRKLGFFVKIGVKLRLLPQILYLKYAR